MLSQPGQKPRVNPRADILPGWILSGRGKFFFEFGPAIWIKFEEQAFCIFRCPLIWTGERVIVPTKRMNRADEIKWRLRVGDTPNATFRERLCSARRVCEQGSGTEQEESNPNAGFSLNGQKHFRFLAEKTARSTNSFLELHSDCLGHRHLRPGRFFDSIAGNDHFGEMSVRAGIPEHFMVSHLLFSADDWQIIKVNGHDYLTVENIAKFYGLPTDVVPSGEKIQREAVKNPLEFVRGSREAMINGARSWLCFPSVEQDGKILVSRTDVAKTIEPLLRPKRV